MRWYRENGTTNFVKWIAEGSNFDSFFVRHDVCKALYGVEWKFPDQASFTGNFPFWHVAIHQYVLKETKQDKLNYLAQYLG